MATVDLDVKGRQVVTRMDAGPGPFLCREGQPEVPGYAGVWEICMARDADGLYRKAL